METRPAPYRSSRPSRPSRRTPGWVGALVSAGLAVTGLAVVSAPTPATAAPTATGAGTATGTATTRTAATGVSGSTTVVAHRRPALPRGLPYGVPAAARRPEPGLGTPSGWPFAQRISHTAGTGRLFGGASYWTDFVYDDHGAAETTGVSLQNTAALAPTQGVATYSSSAAHANGADIFVAAVGATKRATYWRVDWNTLADPRVPIAVWTFDTDGRTSTGVSAWPADAGVESPGIDEALVVSSRGAWLDDLTTGKSTDVATHGGHLTVDRRHRSFVVRVPRSLMRVSGSWRIRLAAGVASADGRTMATPSTSGMPPASGARPYNLAFRTVRQEPPVYTDGQTSAQVAGIQALAATTPGLATLGVDGLARFVTGNFWSEDHQADALATGDVSAFSERVRWSALLHRRSTPEPFVHGTSTRWYATRLHLGQGVVADKGSPSGDGRPNFLGRIQPYTVYVPRSYRTRHGRPAPLTWILHSLSVNHNQYAAYDPRLLRQLCERRHSICATTLGFGPDGWYFNEAENDYWSVWGALAHAYRLDPRGTVISGYSMGGWATYKLGLSHPDLYAAAVTLAGPPRCGVTVDNSAVVQPAFGGDCTSDGSSTPLIANAKWLPYRIGQGTADELVPFTSVERQINLFAQHGLRYRFVRYPGEDHLAWATQDRFDSVVDGLGHPHVVTRPRFVDYTWQPHLTDRRLGIGATTAYWVGGLGARTSGPGSLARVRATSFALPGRHHRVVAHGPTPITSPLPAVSMGRTWRLGGAYPRYHRLSLRLTNVSRLSVDLRRARLGCGSRVAVATDGPVRLRLLHLGPGDLTRTYRLTGRRVLRLGCR